MSPSSLAPFICAPIYHPLRHFLSPYTASQAKPSLSTYTKHLLVISQVLIPPPVLHHRFRMLLLIFRSLGHEVPSDSPPLPPFLSGNPLYFPQCDPGSLWVIARVVHTSTALFSNTGLVVGEGDGGKRRCSSCALKMRINEKNIQSVASHCLLGSYPVTQMASGRRV